MAELALVPSSPTQRTTLAPTTFEEAKAFAEYLSKSDLVPKQYIGKPANIVVAMQHGMEIGLPVLQSLQAIAVINGVPSLWGDSMLALVMSHSEYVSHEEYIEGEGDSRVAVFSIQRKGHKLHTSKFSVADAKKADLWDTRPRLTRKNRESGKEYEVANDSPWYCYTERMMKLRARGFGLRDKFPDALKGMVSREEAMDYPGITIEGVIDQPAGGKSDPPVLIAKVSEDEARAFGAAWKASGWTITEAKAALKEQIGAGSEKGPIGVASSLDIPKDRYEEAMVWAKTPKPVVAEKSAEELKSVDAFKILDWNEKEQGRFIAQYNSDWLKILSELNVLIDKRNAHEGE